MLWLLWLPVTLAAPKILPLVDPGLFVISGVSTCGGGEGYCLLGLDCTLDEDFLPDLGAGQHCEGLRSAFTPSAHFVCCRTANNRTTYKPPLLLPSVATTEQSTTLDVLENEIDQVVSKVVQSVDSVNVVTTEKSEAVDDDEMMADSPDETEEDEESSEEDEDETEESEEESSYPSSHITISSHNPSGETESPSSEEDSSEESFPEKIESSENSIKPFYSVKPVITTNNSPKSDLKPEIMKSNNTPGGEAEVQLNHGDKTSNLIIPEEHSLESMSSKETPLQNEILQADDSKDEDTNSKTNELTDTATPKENINPDKVTPKTEMDKDSEVGHTAPKPPSSENTTSGKIPSTTNSPSISSIFDITPDKTEKNNTKEGSKNPQMSSTKPSTTMNMMSSQSTFEPKEDRLATTTTVSPVTSGRPTTHNGPNGALSPTGQVTQGQPTTCSTNCSDYVMFEFQNQPLCFGAMFTPEWVVTSASCALRIFRVGMVNVNASMGGAPNSAVKTIIVHESYGESSGPAGQQIEANNVGLVRVTPTPRLQCLPCLPYAGQLPQDNCTAAFPSYRNQAQNCSGHGGCDGRATPMRDGGRATCEGPSKLFRDAHGFSYISLDCDTPWPRATTMADSAPNKPWGRGTPLFCDGVLTGVESSVGSGTIVYTPLSHYLLWLNRNTHPGLPEQHFNIG